MRRAVMAAKEAQALPRALEEPARVGRTAQALFNPAVAGVGLGPARGGSRRADEVGEEKPRVPMRARLIASEGEHVLGALDDAPGNSRQWFRKASDVRNIWLCTAAAACLTGACRASVLGTVSAQLPGPSC